MASAPQAQNLPLLYKDLVPLNVEQHGNYKLRIENKAPYIVGVHAVPLTIDEFAACQRFMPIVFAAGDNPVPLALMGLNEGVNTLVGDDGVLHRDDGYVPAYVRRYPWMLAKLDQKSENMSLCFDPSAGLLGDFKKGDQLFEDGKPSEFTQGVMKFCESFEEAGQRTQLFIDEIKKHDLLTDGEVGITQEGQEQPYVYRGFQMLNMDKFREIRGDQLRTWNQNGMLGLIYAHAISLDLLRVIFARQTNQGKGPGAAAAAASNGADKKAKK